MLLPPKGTLRVFVFSVGPGDHILIVFPDGSVGIVDFCYDTRLRFHDTNKKLGRPPGLYFLEYFKRIQKPLSVKLCHVSHPDSDHVSGIEKFVDFLQSSGSGELGYFWWFGGDNTNEKASVLIDALREYQVRDYETRTDPKVHPTRNNSNAIKSIIVRILKLIDLADMAQEPTQLTRLGDTPIAWADGITSYALAPTAEDLGNYFDQIARFIDTDRLLGHKLAPDRPNNNQVSTALLLANHEYRLLLGGDVTKESWENAFEAVSNDPSLLPSLFWANWIKICHHGSKGSSSSTIWQWLMPKEYKKVYGAISAGQHGGYKHPNEQTLREFIGKAVEKNLIPHLAATNTCYECLSRLVNEEVVLDDIFSWELEQQSKAGEPVLQGLQNLIDTEDELLHESRKEKTVAALIYDFLPNGEIEIKLGVTTVLSNERIPGEEGLWKCIHLGPVDSGLQAE